MRMLLSFVADSWWLWLIIAICCFGLFFHNVGLYELIKKRLAELDNDAEDNRTLKEAVRQGARDGLKDGEAMVAVAPRSVITHLAYLGTKIFLPLTVVGLVLKWIGY